MDIIKSKDNIKIKEIKKLKDKRHRIKSGKFLVEGFRFVEEAFKSSYTVEYVVINDKFKHKIKEFDGEFENQSKTKIFHVSESLFKWICDTENPQGILAVVNNKESIIENKAGFFVLADKIQDPGNMGTIIRTAHAAGALGVIITKGTVDIYNEKTLRSTMGSIFKIPVIQDNDLTNIVSLKEKGFKLITTSLQTDKNFYDVNLLENVILTVGNEGNGISDEIFKLSDTKVKIPMHGDAESLNAAVAASIMMFEVVRQKEQYIV